MSDEEKKRNEDRGRKDHLEKKKKDRADYSDFYESEKMQSPEPWPDPPEKDDKKE